MRTRWRGLRDNELSEKSGIPGCIFVHASGFIGGKSVVCVVRTISMGFPTGNEMRDGALQLAKAALTY